jgi:3-hydroxyisobutyrate dehydrogenase-like beta-hydroxyacid dehydrogenase
MEMQVSVDINLGIFKNGMEGALIIDSSTISPAVSQNLSAKAKNWNMTYVDAPVAGGVMGANNATLTFLVGSDSEADYLRARPIIETMGEKIFWIKRAGGGQIVKMCSNIAVAA